MHCMQVDVHGGARPTPFLQARDLFRTEYDLDLPVKVFVDTDPDQRTYTTHADDHHVLTMSRAAASSGMARELALHEYAHMYRSEQGHPSHTQSTAEALYLALAGRQVERRTISQCYQIANHMKDIYADDITLALGPSEKLVTFLESELARAIADRSPTVPSQWTRTTEHSDPEITAINAAFALALLERHDLIGKQHPIYDFAAIASTDAPTISLDTFKRRFRDLDDWCDRSEYRRTLVDAVDDFASARPAPAAD